MSTSAGSDPAGSAVAERLRAEGHELPTTPEPLGHYTGARLVGRQVRLSGHTDRGEGGRTGGGPLRDAEPEIAAARRCAELAALHLLASAATVYDLDALTLSHLRGYVVAVPEFVSHQQVVDAASTLLHRALGGAPHTRAAIGVASLPGGAVVELEAIFELAEPSPDVA